MSCRLETVPARLLDLGRIDLGSKELDVVVAPEPFEQEAPRQPKVDDPGSCKVPVRVAQQAMHLRVAVLDIEEEPPLVTPVGRVPEVEEAAGRHAGRLRAVTRGRLGSGLYHRAPSSSRSVTTTSPLNRRWRRVRSSPCRREP